jgi:DNA-binding transcriptional LysR family regulator
LRRRARQGELTGETVSHVDQVLAGLNRRRRVTMTVNQFYTAARVVEHTDLLTVLPRGFLPATDDGRELVARALPFDAEGVHIDALWHLRADGGAAHEWLRERLREAASGHDVERAGPPAG